MRAQVVVIAIVASSGIAAAELKHEDAELPRPELTTMTAVRYEPKATKLVETARELRRYDAKGQITRHEHRDGAGKLIVAYDFVWDPQGRLASRTYRDHTNRTEARTFTYKTDANGRISVRVMRDPTKDPKEFFRYEYIWEPSGRRTEQSYRHYPKEGPYRSSSEVYDATNRLERNCYEHSGCSMYEYDKHGNLDRIRQQSSGEHHYITYENTYDASGRLTRQIMGNSDSTFTWNARGDVTEVVTKTIAAQGGALQGKTVYTYGYR